MRLKPFHIPAGVLPVSYRQTERNLQQYPVWALVLHEIKEAHIREASSSGGLSGDRVQGGDQLKIGGKKFKVIMTDQVCKDSLFFGQVDFVKQTISIDRTPNIDTQRETLLHETLHCILEAAGKHEQSNDEELICTIASGLNDVLSANRWMLGLFAED